ncbi:Holliday junction resolvase RuvX [Rhabdothermincola sp.]|uniref:Holliday junction resolvase RuvX n=1 Tax=Rhabdothermincola sp. TaxID=2820405 RepID=UPI002FE323F2
MRVLALDLGTKRIGVAVSDPTGTLASPLEVLARSGDRALDHQRIGQLVDDTAAERVVVGLPLSLDGSIGPAAAAVLEEVDELAAALHVPVETYDERLTTVTADRALTERGLRAEARRRVVDKAAATVLLQAWLDGRPGVESST